AGPRREPAVLQGVVPGYERQVSRIGEHMVQGSLDDLAPGSFNIVLGRELALWLGVGVGDKVIVTTDFQTTPMGAVPQLKRFTVSGLFQVGHQQFDKGLAVANMDDLQRVLRIGDGVTGVRLRLHDMDLAWQVARSEERRVGKEWRWLERRGAL